MYIPADRLQLLGYATRVCLCSRCLGDMIREKGEVQ